MFGRSARSPSGAPTLPGEPCDRRCHLPAFWRRNAEANDRFTSLHGVEAGLLCTQVLFIARHGNHDQRRWVHLDARWDCAA